MRVQKAEEHLKDCMRDLVVTRGMLTGLTVCYGTADERVIHSIGNSRETLWNGAAFLDDAKAITDITIYDIASLTKLFTLVSVLQMKQAGALKLRDSIGSLDPRFVHLNDCSLSDCLDYTAVLKTPERVDVQTDAQAAESMVFQTRRFHPEGMRLYSDMNALVLKYVVESVSGLPFFEYVSAHILRPAGMENTWVSPPLSRLDDLMNYNYEHKYIEGQYHVAMDVPPGAPHDPKARLLKQHAQDLAGHAGLFATAGDLCLFAQALLRGDLLPLEVVKTIGVNRTGYLHHDGEYRQFLGLLAFSKSPIQRFSEVPEWMGLRAFGISGYTGNHFALDPDQGVFDLLLGNRCHNRLSLVSPEEQTAALGLMDDGSGSVSWPDGRQVRSSFRFIHQKDRMVHNPVFACLQQRNWI